MSGIQLLTGMPPHLPPLLSLRAFEAAARHLSFQAAAAELGVTPTAISHQIRKLEEACGSALFRRRPRPLVLTEAGARLAPVLRAGFDSFAVAIDGLHAAEDGRPLRVTTTNAFAHRWLVPRLPRWRAAQPGRALEVIGTDAVVDLAAGQADIAIRYARAAPPGLIAEEFLRDRFWPMCSPELLARPGQVAELLRYPLIHMHWQVSEPAAPTWARWLAAAQAQNPALRGLVAPGGLLFREELHAIEAMIAGQGIAICSDVLVARELRSGALLKAHDLALPGFGFWLAYRPGQGRRTAIEAFIAWVRNASDD